MKTYTINHGLNCDDKYLLIYFLTFKKCFKQYVGEPTVIFHKKWNNCKNNSSKFFRGKRHSKTFKDIQSIQRHTGKVQGTLAS